MDEAFDEAFSEKIARRYRLLNNFKLNNFETE